MIIMRGISDLQLLPCIWLTIIVFSSIFRGGLWQHIRAKRVEETAAKDDVL